MYIDSYSPDKTYTVGRLAKYQDKIYHCVIPNRGRVPGTGSEWDLVGLPLSESMGVITVNATLNASGLQVGGSSVDTNEGSKVIRLQPVLGAIAPEAVVVGTASGLGFDADDEEVYLHTIVPTDWNGTSDLTLRVYFVPEDGTAIADEETVKFDISYRSKVTLEVFDSGDAALATGSYIQSGAGVDKQFLSVAVTIDHDDLDQPILPGDHLFILFVRDFSGDTYAADAVVTSWQLEYSL